MTNFWTSTNSTIAKGRGIIEALTVALRGVPREIEGSVETHADLNNSVKWTDRTLTASRACKPSGEMWSAYSTIKKTYPNVEFIATPVPEHPKKVNNFNENPKAYLITRCDAGAKELQKHKEMDENTTLLSELEDFIIKHENKRSTTSTNALIKETDSRNFEKEYPERKFHPNHLLIDTDARRIDTLMTTTELKCVAGFNQHGSRDKLINPNKSDLCNLCRQIENWAHIVTCPCNKEQNKSFMESLRQEILTASDTSIDTDIMTKSLANFLQGKSQLTGTQLLIGYQCVFRGIIVSDWEGGNEAELKYKQLNKIIVRRCVRYYSDCSKLRCTRQDSDSVRRKYLLEWAKNEINFVENRTHPEVSKYVLLSSEKIVTMASDSIQKWLVTLHAIKKGI